MEFAGGGGGGGEKHYSETRKFVNETTVQGQ